MTSSAPRREDSAVRDNYAARPAPHGCRDRHRGSGVRAVDATAILVGCLSSQICFISTRSAVLVRRSLRSAPPDSLANLDRHSHRAVCRYRLAFAAGLVGIVPERGIGTQRDGLRPPMPATTTCAGATGFGWCSSGRDFGAPGPSVHSRPVRSREAVCPPASCRKDSTHCRASVSSQKLHFASAYIRCPDHSLSCS